MEKRREEREKITPPQENEKKRGKKKKNWERKLQGNPQKTESIYFGLKFINLILAFSFFQNMK